MAWGTYKISPRKRELPANWASLRKQVIARDGGRCVQCGAKGNHVDHIMRGSDHSLSNLRLLCASCHMKRTGRDGGSAKRRPKRKWDRTEAHPGRLA